jgi:hypothetical protein
MKPPIVTDRLAGIVAGAVLVLTGLVLIDWHTGWVFTSHPSELDTARVGEVVDSTWWPWAAAAVGLLLGLLGIRWLLTHLRRDAVGDVRLRESDPTGRVEIDLDSVADAAASRFRELAPVSTSSGSTTVLSQRRIVVVDARLETGADADAVVAAAEQCAGEVDQAFPDGTVSCRFLIDQPRRQRRRRSAQVRVD